MQLHLSVTPICRVRFDGSSDHVNLEGIRRPPGRSCRPRRTRATPADAFRAALRAFVRGPGWTWKNWLRISAFQRPPSTAGPAPDKLLSEILCFFGEEAARIGREASEGATGVRRIELFTRGFVESIVNFEPHRRFVRSETELAFRLVLTRGSQVQSTVVERFAEVLREEEASGNLGLRAPGR